VSTPRKPETAFKKSVRAVEIGVALGVAGFILNALISGEIAALQFQSEGEHLAPQLLLLVLPSLIIAPALAFAAGMLVEGSRWRIVISQNLTLQATVLLVPAVSVGIAEFFTPAITAVEVGLLVVGTVLSGLAMGRAQRRKPEPEKKQASLAAIDFEKVKQEAGAAAAQPAPAADAPPASAPAPAAATPAPAPTAAAAPPEIPAAAPTQAPAAPALAAESAAGAVDAKPKA
jgi:hypothetical protein